MATYQDIKAANDAINATPIKGKNYAEVNQRIKAFRMVYPEGTIHTEMISNVDGVCIFRAVVSNDQNHVIGTGTAYEKESSSFINKTSYIENCVPLDTQILTKDGWKYYYQVNEGDDVYSLNMDTKEIELCKLLKVNRHENRPIVELKTSRFKVRCTDQHKWVVRSQYEGLKKVPTSELKTCQKIVQNVPQNTVKTFDGRQLGWLMCDCEISRTKNGMPSRAEITQCKHVDDLRSLFGEPAAVATFSNGWKDCYTWEIPAETVRKIFSYWGISTYEDLKRFALTATIGDVAGCYHSMMLADGSKGRFSSTYLELVEAVQLMCVRLGIATTFVTQRTMKNSTKPLYELGIKKGDGSYVSEMKIKKLPPQDVWCPTTENGTWFMRQGTFVTLTSNCETSAVGRALGMAGFGIDVSIASAEEVQNAMLNQQKSSRDESFDSKKWWVALKPETKKQWTDHYKITDPKDEDILKFYKIVIAKRGGKA